MPFEWGKDQNDCASFAGGAVLALTGSDPLEGLHWTTRLGAIRVMKKGGGMEAIITRRLRPVPLSMAQRGDVAAIPDPDLGLSLVIVEADRLIGPGEFGRVELKRAAMVRAWSAA